MTKLDQQIRQVVGEVVDSAPIVDSMPLRQSEIDRNSIRPRQRRRLLVGAIASVAIAGLAFVAVGPGGGTGDEGVAATESADGTTAPLSDSQWPYPRVLPDGYEFDFAMRSSVVRQIMFASSDGDSSFSISIVDGTEDPARGGAADRSVVLNGTTWYEAAGERNYVRADGDVEVFFADGTDLDTALAVLESIEIVDEEFLPRPPLPSFMDGMYTEVAFAEADGVTDRLSVATDGKYYTSRTLGSGGCCTPFGDDEVIVLMGGVWPDTEVGSVTAGEGLVEAIVSPSVATVQIDLTDGSTIIAEPQDTNDSFPVNFIFATIPVRGDELLSQVQAILALDEDGNELARLSGDDLDF